MITLVDPFFFLLGLIVGSFLNVVIYRHNTGRGVVTGRSACLTCGQTLKWYELLPLVSFLIQLGRCRGCGSRISWQYPLVELVTAGLFAATWRVIGLDFLPLAIHLIIFSLLILITVYDLKHKIIPDIWSYAFAIFAALNLILTAPPAGWLNHIYTAVGAFLFFFALWYLSRGRWMGFGDAKLAVGIGLFLPPLQALSALVLAFWLGAAVGLLIILFSRLLRGRKSFTIKSEIPFAPFLIVGVMIIFFCHFNVFSFFQIF